MGNVIASAAPATVDKLIAREAAAIPSSAAEALAFVRAGLDWLASTDATELTGAERADCLRALVAAESVQLAAVTRNVSAFDSAEDNEANGQDRSREW